MVRVEGTKKLTRNYDVFKVIVFTHKEKVYFPTSLVGWVTNLLAKIIIFQLLNNHMLIILWKAYIKIARNSVNFVLVNHTA